MSNNIPNQMDFGFGILICVIRLILAETISANAHMISSLEQRAEE
jgi:di/tricarboxylate transporter